MAKKNPNQSGNPLKEEGQSKPTTRAKADQEPPVKPRKPVSEMVTGQGGSDKGGGKAADMRHPSQHGGVKPPLDEEGLKRARSTKPGYITGQAGDQE